MKLIIYFNLLFTKNTLNVHGLSYFIILQNKDYIYIDLIMSFIVNHKI